MAINDFSWTASGGDIPIVFEYGVLYNSVTGEVKEEFVPCWCVDTADWEYIKMTKEWEAACES